MSARAPIRRLLPALAVLLIAAPALAQAGGEAPRQTTVSPPAERMLVTPSGVDTRSGQYAYSQTDLSIGEDNETGGMALTRTMSADVPGHANPFANFSHNWEIMLTSKGIDIDEGQYNLNAGPDLRVQVHFGGRSETFDRRAENSGFDEISRNGYARLTYSGSPASFVYTMTTGDGTVALFRPLANECSAAIACAFVASVTYADGTRFTFDYDAGTPTRLRAVTSNRGYALLLQYGGGADAGHVVSACVINLSVQAKPANNSCPASPQASTSYTYSAFESGRRLATVVDANGEIWSFTYARVNGTLRTGFLRPGDSAAWLTNTLAERTDNDGMIDELVDSQAFVDGSTWTYTRSYAPQVEGEIPQVAGGHYLDPAGHQTTIEYGFFPRPDAFNPPRVNSQGYPYVNYGDVFMQITPGPISVTDPLGRVTSWDYCDPNAACLVRAMPVSFTEPDGRRTDLLNDEVARVVVRGTRHALSGSGLADIVTQSSYVCTPTAMVNCTKPATTTDARGNVAEYVWDPVHGGLLSATGPAPVAGAPRPQTRHSYAQRYAWIANGSGFWVQAATPVWVRTATSACRTSAATGNPAAPCATAGDEVLTQYDYGSDAGPNTLLLRGQTVTATDNGATTTLRTCYTYDARGRRIGETRPNANLASCPASQTAAQPFTSNQRYDAMGRVTGTISADPDTIGADNPHVAVRNSYDGAGRLVKVETGHLSVWQPDTVAPAYWGSAFVPDRTLETSYDAMGRKVREQVREGGSGPVRTLTQYSYDVMGRVECSAVLMNPAAFASPPASVCTLGPQGTGADDYGPDRITRNSYDAAGQRTLVVEGVGTVDQGVEVQYTYTANGEVMNVIDGNGNASRFDYDGHGRRSHFWFPNPATTGEVSYSDYEAYYYDADSNRTAVRRRDGRNIIYNYDALNRVTSKIYPNGGATPVYYGYDLRGLQLFARFDSTSGAGVANAFDGFGRLVSTTVSTDGTARTLAFQYDRDGNRTRITHPDGILFDTLRDGLDRPYWLNSVVYPAYGCYYSSYRPDGLPASQSRCNGASTWTSRDGVGRLNGVGHYYGAGGTNDVLWLYDHNPASQIRSANRDNDAYAWTGHYAVSRNYAVNGLNQYTAAGGASFGYDANGNLTSDGSRTYVYDIENRLVSSSSGAALAYDPLGRLYQVTAPGGAVTHFLYDGDALVAEYDGSGAMTHRYVHWDGDDVPIISYDGATLTTPNYLHADHQGSIVAISGASGASQINRNDEYGIPAAANSGRFQYTGQAWLPELGMYYYKARIYSPTLGRFLQTDPVGYDDQFNLYEYVGDDPVNHSDPSGECCFESMDPRRDQVTRMGDASRQFAREHPQAAKVVAIAGAVLMTGGTAIAVAPEIVGGAAIVGTLETEAGGAGGSLMAEAEIGAQAEAAAVRSEAAAAGQRAEGVTSGLRTPSGRTFTGRSARAGGPGRATNPRVQGALNGVTQRSPFHGCCGEIHALSRALNAGEDVAGSAIAAVRAATGEAMEACASCRAVLRVFGIHF